MGVVTRRSGESLTIELPTGELIEVTVLSVQGDQARLRIDAPKELLVLRAELLDRFCDLLLKKPAPP